MSVRTALPSSVPSPQNISHHSERRCTPTIRREVRQRLRACAASVRTRRSFISAPPHRIIPTSSQFVLMANHLDALSERSNITGEVLMYSVRNEQHPSFFCTTLRDYALHHLNSNAMANHLDCPERAAEQHQQGMLYSVQLDKDRVLESPVEGAI